ncbi:FtsX-like permease family protein [Symbioplanes lichenis]|uniref:FtsX-like permease family protein n=1 Tax=Symbioplanes lichenis TaxID=1629072 RepID=UPI002739817F|nr:FtsX-like permease family protein [Actinoplanes lichenis]
MIAVAWRSLRHRPGGFAATFLSALLGATLLTAFASLIDTAAGADAASAESLITTASVAGGWCLVIVVFAVTSTLGLSVRRRAEEVALLRRTGATRGQVRRMIVGEAALVALIAATVAVPGGLLLGRVLLALLHDTGQVAEAVGYEFGPIALAAGFGVTLLGSLIAAVAAERRTREGVRKDRPRTRRIAAGVFLAAGVSCGIVTATVMRGKGIDAMQTAGQAGIWASIGLALLAPELLRAVSAPLRPMARKPAGAVMPVTLFSGIATGTVIMQETEDRAAAGTIVPDFAADIQTLNYTVVGMITLFVAVMLVNTLIAATTGRRREFAQLRLAGATRGQLTAMVALEGALAAITGVAAGSVAALCTIVPFALARTGVVWPQPSPCPYLVIVGVALTLTGAALLGTTRRVIAGPVPALLS